MSRSRTIVRATIALVVAALTLGLVAGAATAKTDKAAAQNTEPVTLRLGYFANVTHAPALVGVEGGIFKQKLGKNVTLEPKIFNSGTEAIEAILADALDASYIGPNPTITAWTQFDKGVRVISGAASGGAFFVVKPDINNAADLKGKTVASPQLGNTQDVALRTWLKKQGLSTDTAGGGDVSIKPAGQRHDAHHLQVRRHRGRVGARAVGDAARHRGRRQDARRRGDALARGSVRHDAAHRDHEVPQGPPRRRAAARRTRRSRSNDYIKNNTADAQSLVQQGIANATGKPISGDLVIASFKNIEFTNDPIASSLVKVNKDAEGARVPGRPTV